MQEMSATVVKLQDLCLHRDEQTLKARDETSATLDQLKAAKVAPGKRLSCQTSASVCSHLLKYISIPCSKYCYRLHKLLAGMCGDAQPHLKVIRALTAA